MVMAKHLTERITDIQVRTKNPSISYELFIMNLNILPKFRGSPVSNQEKKRLNQLGGKILREAGLNFEEWKDYDWITKGVHHRDGIDDEGYADYYLVRCWNDSKKISEANTSVYRQLVQIDSKLGTSISMQLSCCLSWTTRWDIIEV